MKMKVKASSLLTLVVVLLVCLSTGTARKNRGKNRKQLPKSPEWKSGSDPGRDERILSENEEELVRLDCRAKGKPTPKVTWYKDGQVISPSNDRVQVKKYKLTIPSLAEQDKGNYTCIVSNTEGQLEWTFYVDVVVRVWPLIVEGPANVTALEGQRVRFECRVLNDPVATLRWVKPSPHFESGNSALSSSNYRPTPEFLEDPDNPGVLELQDVQAKDAGEYRCMAGNVWGLKYTSAYLTIITTTTTTSTTTTTTTTTPPTTTSTTTTTTTTPRTTSTTFSPYFQPGRTMLYPVPYGPDLYPTTTRPPRHHRKDRKDKDRKEKGHRRKNGRRRKNKKKDRTTPPTTLPTTPFSFFRPASSSSPSVYDSFTTIWNMDDGMGVGDNEFPAGYDMEDEVMEGDYEESTGEGEGWVSLWTIYTIVGAIAGVILLIGLLAIVIAVCCRKEETVGYKSTPV